jgi:15-cis-phytoene synthase
VSPDAGDPRGPARELHGSARDLACLYAPPTERAALGAVLDIEREVEATLRPGLEHTVAHVRLQWWREECERCALGRPLHPATRALVAALGGPADPGGLVSIATWDLAAATFATRAELAGYCERWASATIQLAAQGARAAHSAAADDAARAARARFGRSLGAALKEIELLGNLARDAAAGRLRLPLDELARIGVDPAALARPPWPQALSRLLERCHHEARAALVASVAALPASEQPAMRGLIVWAALAHRASRRAERALPADARAGRARGRAELAGRMGDAWLAWRAARRADRATFRFG